MKIGRKGLKSILFKIKDQIISLFNTIPIFLEKEPILNPKYYHMEET